MDDHEAPLMHRFKMFLAAWKVTVSPVISSVYIYIHIYIYTSLASVVMGIALPPMIGRSLYLLVIVSLLT